MISDKTITNLSIKSNSYTHTISNNLFLLIEPSGKKYWRMRYTFNGTQRLLSLGKFPSINVKSALEKRDEIFELINNNVDPILHKKDKKLKESNKDSFNHVFNEYIESLNLSINYRNRVIHYFNLYLKNTISKRKIDTFEAYELIQLCKKIKSQTISILVLNIIKRTLRYAKINGLIKISPLEDTNGAIKKNKTIHHPCIIDGIHNKTERMKAVGKLLRDISNSHSTFIVKNALAMLAFIFVRPSELVSMKWNQIDFEEKLWRYTSTKTNVEHSVPLSNSLLKALNRIKENKLNDEYVFPNRKNPRKHLTVTSLNTSLREMGYEGKHVPHGFRALARTILEEDLKYPANIIELQLTHKVRDSLGRAYNRTTFIEERKEMMSGWSNYLRDCLNT